MTPARILAICRDEWPALRWRWVDNSTLFRPHAAARIRGDDDVAVVPSTLGLGVYVDLTIGGHLRAIDDYTLTERGIRAALREARRHSNGETP